ncbi:MAG TPA: hypothetical protein VKM00_09940 [Luteimonas sp.]|nr:hypothetical protein [Luteimonas sp.]
MRVIALCFASSLVLLTACQGKQEQTPAAAAQPAPAAAVAATPPPAADVGKPGAPGMLPDMAPKIIMDTTPVDTQIADVKLSDNADEKKLTGMMTSQFKPTDGVFMSIRTQGTAAKYTLSSKWLTPAGETLTEYSQVLTTAGVNDTIFSLSKPDGWAKGEYKVELSVNGKLLKTVPFTVR